MVSVDQWRGLIAQDRSQGAEKTLQVPLESSTAGSSGTFVGRAMDGIRYWIKPLNNLQGPHVPVIEQIVGRAGSLIDAPTCQVCTIEIPEELVGWEFRPGAFLEAGIAHGSRALGGSREVNELKYRSDDDNRLRHCYILALHDWCWGYDVEWLIDVGNENRYFSHDHGWYLPPKGATLDAKLILDKVDRPHELFDSGGQIDVIHAQTVADALNRVTRNQLVKTLSAVPREWPITDDELEAVGYFLERRAPQVAERLLRRFGGT